jgi:hypothetical protein
VNDTKCPCTDLYVMRSDPIATKAGYKLLPLFQAARNGSMVVVSCKFSSNTVAWVF